MIKPRFGFLVSYWYYRNVDLDEFLATHFKEPENIDVFADSGAFSAMTQGGEVCIDEYAAWVKQWEHIFTSYANLDVIMDAEQTWKNQQKLESYGLEPVPCFHVNEDFVWLERYLEKHQYIALGVAGMQTRDGILPWLIKCFQLAKDRAVYHGFGLTGWPVLRTFPWYSVDSSAWMSGVIYGRVVVWHSKERRLIRLNLGDREAWFKHRDIIADLGFNSLDFANRQRNERYAIAGISALSFVHAQAWLRNFHGLVERPDDPTADKGLKMYYVDSCTNGQCYATAERHFIDFYGET